MVKVISTPWEEADKLPSHWEGRPRSMAAMQTWALYVVDHAVQEQLQKFLHVSAGTELGKGRDAALLGYKRAYSDLELFCAWRLEYPEMWHVYEARRSMIGKQAKRFQTAGLRKADVTPTTAACAEGLPGAVSANANEVFLLHGVKPEYLLEIIQQGLSEKLSSLSGAFGAAVYLALPGAVSANANEVFLLHGVKPEYLLEIIQQGLSEKLSSLSGAFGAAVYLAEDVVKIDQYTTPDSHFKQEGLSALHTRLFRGYRQGSVKHPGEDLFYCLVVRTTLGWVVRTNDGKACLDDDDQSLYASADCRELAKINGSEPPERYHSLVVETGKTLKRFREFCVFDSAQTYVEYIIAYKRI
eukprot:gnl/TRDRNA2_/TRDRNA2_93513_c0_seq1.p1 gnl/TRDRNA2_/TRDRNA2_93513_c0~~gnl/TRDRNA2_/TRDRNA2_93513_c0_seq1.p1  ORF type:complete len:356 (-),score=56.54 gnl/TRDRNA2_/TRDRNA2_93513_c0_seq1:51-1118(-)